MASTPVIEAIRLTKAHARRQLLDEVSLSVARGDLYALVGGAGSGKTALLRALVGLSYPDTGSARIMGQVPGPGAYRVFQRVGFLSADPPVRRGVSVRHDVEMGLSLAGIVEPGAADRALSLLGIQDLAEHPAASLGDDDRRLLGIARAIAPSPELLVLDEPTRGLGGLERRRVLDLLRMLSVEREITMIVATRVADGVVESASHVGVMRGGRLVAEFDREGLRERGREHVEIVVSDPPRAALVLEERLGLTDFAVCQERLIRIYVPGTRVSEINSALVADGIEVTSLSVNAGALVELLERLSGEGEASQ
ncbi:MAG: ABC transporter ATP-binding protein [Actinobacteria bacterium]|nr:ABC transporter ATP-binding protein [Actinomycetota bacterium]MCG2807756.1 ABC transporter ATP-binding protein [Coriobacteriia bacterium]